ncbi:MAG: T9SS type A sorting domain-containing protein [bacterium]
MKVLEDDLGAYDKTMWRFFDYKTDNDESARFLEGSDARAFTPGRSYFIVTRQENIIVDSGPGVTRRTVCNDTIRVYEGWNLIATPFNFPVGRESLHLVNTGSDNDAGISLRSYERGWNIVDVMDTWKGYAFFVTKARDSSGETPIYLVVEPKAVPGRVAKASAPFELQPGDWRIQISGRAGEQRDVENWAGVQMNATHAYDKFELAEPPVIGQYLSLAFPHPEWRLAVDNFSTDIRPAVEQEQVWEFEVKTNLPKTEVRLSFNFIGDFPKEPEVHLLDDALQLSQNLRVNTEYSFQSGSQGSTKRLKLIVGSQEFALKQAGDVGLAPEKFELLQNFPNPFNPETSIRYNLAEATKVTFEIFDLLGRKVSTLVDNQHQEIGFYTVSWNGRDRNGKPAASGVYIYRITTESQTFTRKMILMK